jgi:chromosome segregation protein
MPLRLKSLDLHGYKTFAAKTNFVFAEGITAIVGPNGSGKSNIADALRWVLGEQSYSLLRAKKTEDMIFAGSEQRPRLGMASAGVVFNNADGWLPVDYSEVALARRSFRDGRNEYLLNGQHVRLKDIHELLAQSGLSERTYTILGQGLVDASLALKADERRRLFEEAAGIGLYQTRREEALRRLENTRRNLDRVLDILAELEPRLRSLERQAARARDYAQIQTDLRVLLLDWYGFHWHRAQRELSDVHDRGRAQEGQLLNARESYQNVRRDFIIYRDHLNSLRVKVNSWHRQSAQLHESREVFSGNLAMLEERKRALLDNHQSVLRDLSQLSDEIIIARDQINELSAEISRVQVEYDQTQAQTVAAQSTLNFRRSEKSQLDLNLQATRRKVEEFNLRQAGLVAQLNELVSRKEGQKQRLGLIANAIISAESEVEEAARQLKEATETRQRIETSVQKRETELQVVQQQQIDLETQVKENQIGCSSLQAEKARFKAQLEVLDQSEQSLIGYAEGAKLLLEASRQFKLGSALGALSSAMDVPAELEVAIAAALGEYTDAILLESSKDAENAMLMLESNQAGRASLLPLDWLVPIEPLKVKKDADCLGVASELVSTVSEYRAVLDILLGRVLIVRDRAVARRFLIGQPKDTLVVTLRGEVFYATGQVTAGKTTKAGAIGRLRQRRELQGSLEHIDRQIIKAESELQELSRKVEYALRKASDYQDILAKDRSGLDSARNSEHQVQVYEETARRKLDWQVNQKNNIEIEISQAKKDHEQVSATLLDNKKEESDLQEALRKQSAALAGMDINDIQEQVNFWATRSAVAERALSDTQSRHFERTSTIDRMLLQQASMENRLVEIDNSMEELENTRNNLRGQISGINTQLEEIRNLIEPAEKELETSQTIEIDLQKQEMDGQSALSRFERTNSQIQLEINRKQEILASLRQRIEDDFGLVNFEYSSDVSGPVPLPFDGMVKQLPKVMELPPDLEENMIRLRSQLRRMGAINPEAEQEYQSVKERYTFLTAQLDDLRNAESDLHTVIAELDEITRHQFQKTFEAVADQFHHIFYRLFGGGVARLVLTDPDNLTVTGIDIEARLPGRREQGLSLLSGGERSLTAIALVFSLLKVSPTPFCVLDEVDAMLDEANVGRFRDLLLELSKETQFIIITHNRNTVQAANVIYGITMGRDSVSQLISLKLDEVSEEYLK